MDEQQEQIYIEGGRAVYREMLQLALRGLGYDSPESSASSWILEREAAVSQLRSVCRIYGDNDWSNDLHLADVIDKHLAHHLDEE